MVLSALSHSIAGCNSTFTEAREGRGARHTLPFPSRPLPLAPPGNGSIIIIRSERLFSKTGASGLRWVCLSERSEERCVCREMLSWGCLHNFSREIHVTPTRIFGKFGFVDFLWNSHVLSFHKCRLRVVTPSLTSNPDLNFPMNFI